jgi:hypothetical protein
VKVRRRGSESASETFSVVVTGSGGQATSNPATLTVTASHSGNADPQGIYYGSLKFSAQPAAWPAIAIVRKGTAAVFAIQNYATSLVPPGIGFTGLQVATTGSSFTTTFTAHTQTGYTLTNGGTSATGTLTGTVVPGASIAGSFTSALDNGTFTLTASPASYQPSSSTGLIAGTYHHSYAASSKVYLKSGRTREVSISTSMSLPKRRPHLLRPPRPTTARPSCRRQTRSVRPVQPVMPPIVSSRPNLDNVRFIRRAVAAAEHPEGCHAGGITALCRLTALPSSRRSP